MNHTEAYFTGGKNYQIFYQSWVPDKPKAVVQIIHGAFEHVGRYQKLIDYLVACNIAVYGNDHRGHGKSEGRRNHCDSLDDLVDDCYILTQIIQKEQKGIPIFIVGHSMGSFVGQRFAIKHQEDIKGVVLSGTGTEIPQLPPLLMFTARVLVKIWPTFKGPSGLIPEEISSDPESVENYVNDPLINYKEASIKYGLNMVFNYKEIKDKMSTIKIPVLIQKGDQDNMVIHLDELIEDLKQTDLTVKIYKDSKHEVYTEIKTIREKAFSDLFEWINSHL